MRSFCMLLAVVALPAVVLSLEFVRGPSGMNWQTAQDYCANTYENGHLAVITSISDFEYSSEICNFDGNALCWLGLTWGATGWEWIDGTPVDYGFSTVGDGTSYTYGQQPWNNGEPNGNAGEPCAHITTNTGLWNDLGCSGVMYPLCQIPDAISVDCGALNVDHYLTECSAIFPEASSGWSDNAEDIATLTTDVRNIETAVADLQAQLTIGYAKSVPLSAPLAGSGIDYVGAGAGLLSMNFVVGFLVCTNFGFLLAVCCLWSKVNAALQRKKTRQYASVGVESDSDLERN